MRERDARTFDLAQDIADKVTLGKDELWSVPFAGPVGSLVRLNESGSSETDVTEFEISPDGALNRHRP